MLVASNFTGHPCLHLRAGFLDVGTRGHGLTGGTVTDDGVTHRVPQGISLWGRLFEEGTILSFGQALKVRLVVAAELPKLPA